MFQFTVQSFCFLLWQGSPTQQFSGLIEFVQFEKLKLRSPRRRFIQGRWGRYDPSSVMRLILTYVRKSYIVFFFSTSKRYQAAVLQRDFWIFRSQNPSFESQHNCLLIFLIRQPSGRCRQSMPDHSAFSRNASLKLLPILCPVNVHFRYRMLSTVGKSSKS